MTRASTFWWFGKNQVEAARQITPTTFMGAGSTWAQFGTPDEILAHAVDILSKGADMYYTLRSYDVMELLAKEGIPVQSHIGLIPTYSHWCGGLRAWGRSADEAMEIYRNLKRMEEAGVFAVEVECIAEEVLQAINEKTSVVTFSLGSGNAGDAVFLFMADICGEDSEEEAPPKHAHAFGNLGRLHKQLYEERVAAPQVLPRRGNGQELPLPRAVHRHASRGEGEVPGSAGQGLTSGDRPGRSPFQAVE